MTVVVEFFVFFLLHINLFLLLLTQSASCVCSPTLIYFILILFFFLRCNLFFLFFGFIWSQQHKYTFLNIYIHIMAAAAMVLPFQLLCFSGSAAAPNILHSLHQIALSDVWRGCIWYGIFALFGPQKKKITRITH